MSKRPRPNLTTYMEALGQEFDVEPCSIKKVGFQSGVDSVDVTITVDRSVDPFGSLVAAGSNVIAKSFDEDEVTTTQRLSRGDWEYLVTVFRSCLPREVQ